MSYHTERIWHIVGDSLVPRDGQLIFDEDEAIVDASDALGPIQVIEGLRPQDVAVFMHYLDPLETPPKRRHTKPKYSEETVGYLVTQASVELDGSGILVSGELFERHPRSWLSPALIGTWNGLAIHGYSPDDFELPMLAGYLKHLRQTK